MDPAGIPDPDWPDFLSTDVGALGATMTATVEACVEVMSTTMAGLPHMVARRVSDSSAPGRVRYEPQEDHPIAALLLSPTPVMSGYQFRRVLYRDLYLNGNAYARLLMTRGRMTGQMVTGMAYEAERSVKYNKPVGGARWPTYTVQRPMEGRRDVPYWGMLNLHGPGFDPINGKSPSRLDGAARSAVDVQRKAAKMLARDLGRGFSGKLYVYSEADQMLTADQIDTLTTALKRSLTEGGNPTKIALLQPGLKLASVPGSTAEQFMLDKVLDWTVEEICRAWRMPPRMVHFYRAGTRPSVQKPEADERAFYVNTVVPEAEAISEELTRKLLSPRDKDGDLVIRLDVEAVLRGTLSERALTAELLASRGGLITINEARRLVGYPPVPDGDRLLPSKGAPTEQGGEIDKNAEEKIDEKVDEGEEIG